MFALVSVTSDMVVRALEFYSGIGGLHRALNHCKTDAIIVRAFDWDQSARRVYDANYGPGIAQKADISILSANDLMQFNAQLWLLSPSCQPYTVLNPDAKGAADPRAKSFLHLVENVLPELVSLNAGPRWLLIENVAGFEASTTRHKLLRVLKTLQYVTAELLLTPLQFGIPNSRLRYYLLAKAKPLRFAHSRAISNEEELCSTGTPVVWRHIPGVGQPWEDDRAGEDRSVKAIRDYLDTSTDSNANHESPYLVPDRVLEKWGRLFDIITPKARRTCCFTRGYTQMVERAGSILQMNEELNTTEVFNRFLEAQKLCSHENSCSKLDHAPIEILRPLQLRYFSPAELLRLFHFTALADRAVLDSDEGNVDGMASFVWPEGISEKTKYRLLGNSMNVEVVKRLIDYLFKGDIL